MQFMTDPKKFLYQSLIGNSSNFARKMFNSRGQLRPQYYSTADGLYSFARNFATDGIELGVNGVPRAIALQSLEMIANQFQAALSDLNRAVAMMNAISTAQSQDQAPSSNSSNSYTSRHLNQESSNPGETCSNAVGDLREECECAHNPSCQAVR
jgi:hypothetical protein